MNLTNAQYLLCKPYHKILVKFNNPDYNGYVSAKTREELAEVYNQIVEPKNRTCGNCTNDFIFRLAGWYDKRHQVEEKIATAKAAAAQRAKQQPKSNNKNNKR